MPIILRCFVTTAFFGVLAPMVGAAIFIAYMASSGAEVSGSIDLVYEILGSIGEFGFFAAIAGAVFSFVVVTISRFLGFAWPRWSVVLLGSITLGLVFAIPFVEKLLSGVGFRPVEFMIFAFGALSGLIVGLALPRRLLPIVGASDA